VFDDLADVLRRESTPELYDDQDLDDVGELVEADCVTGAEPSRNCGAEQAHGVHVPQLPGCEPGKTQNGAL
jgi:hypothetical protein